MFINMYRLAGSMLYLYYILNCWCCCWSNSCVVNTFIVIRNIKTKKFVRNEQISKSASKTEIKNDNNNPKRPQYFYLFMFNSIPSEIHCIFVHHRFFIFIQSIQETENERNDKFEEWTRDLRQCKPFYYCWFLSAFRCLLLFVQNETRISYFLVILIIQISVCCFFIILMSTTTLQLSQSVRQSQVDFELYGSLIFSLFACNSFSFCFAFNKLG